MSMDIVYRSLLDMEECSCECVKFCKMAETRKVVKIEEDGSSEFNKRLLRCTFLLPFVFSCSHSVTCS